MRGGIQLIHHARAPFAAADGCAIKVALRVANYPGERRTAFGSSREAMQHSLPACRIYPEDHAGAKFAAVGGGPIKVTRRVADHSTGCASIVAAAEGVEHRLLSG